MSGNPQLAMGNISRVNGTFKCVNYPALNLLSSNLGDAAMTIRAVSPASNPLRAGGGVVQSLEPYQEVEIEIHIVKTHSVAKAWQDQLVDTCLLGECTMTSDSTTLGDYDIQNVAIKTWNPVNNNGKENDIVFLCSGHYYVNNALFS
jgi:hypothetical protein